MYCNVCGGDLTELGILGALHWHRCRACGWECAEEITEEPDVRCDRCKAPAFESELNKVDNRRERCTDYVCDDCLIEAEANAEPDYTGIPVY